MQFEVVFQLYTSKRLRRNLRERFLIETTALQFSVYFVAENVKLLKVHDYSTSQGILSQPCLHQRLLTSRSLFALSHVFHGRPQGPAPDAQRLAALTHAQLFGEWVHTFRVLNVIRLPAWLQQ